MYAAELSIIFDLFLHDLGLADGHLEVLRGGRRVVQLALEEELGREVATHHVDLRAELHEIADRDLLLRIPHEEHLRVERGRVVTLRRLRQTVERRLRR